MKKSNIFRSYIICFLILAVIFTALYHQFIFGGMLYAFDDIGGDTIHLYLPVMEYELELLEQGKDNTYSLQYGLGDYQDGLFAKYLSPVRLLPLIFGSENVHITVLVRAFFLYAVICLFSLLFFNRLFKNEKIAGICALLWTFTAYAVLWGQHYSFLINLTMFTVALYGFQLYLEEDKHWYLVIPCMALLIGFGYYITYMSCFFFLPYGVLYLAYQKKKILYILKRIGIFIPVMLLAACMAGVYIFPSVVTLFQSARLQTNVGTGFTGIPKGHAPLTIFTFITRLINTNLMGVGNNFYATINYYECAILSVSLLFVFAFIYMLQTKYWKRVLIIAGICTVALCSPLTSQLIQFAPFSQRWTFILSMAQILLIGFAMVHIVANRTEIHSKRRYLITVLATDVILLGFCAFLYVFGAMRDIWCNKEALVCVCVILLVYHFAFFLLWKTKIGYRAMVIAVAVELVLANYASVNDRILVPLDTWQNAYANDGTKQVAEWIANRDDSLYRVNKTYISLSYNDSLVQDYNGMGLYQSTASSHLLNVSRSFGYADAFSRINFINNTIMENTLLGVKYVIAHSGTEMDPAYYTQIYDDGTHCVYQNDCALGFGYLYQEQMRESDFYALPSEEAAKLLSRYYYVTGSEDAPSIHSAVPVQIDDSQLLKNLRALQKNAVTDMTQNGNTFTGTVENPYSENAMLCVPLIYSDSWVATVDGELVSVENINAGLVGISVPAGEHTVTICYSSNIHFLGVICSCVGIVIFALFLTGRWIYQRRQTISQ